MARLHKPLLIICEGAADRKFVKYLLEVREVEHDFELVGHKEEIGSGNSTFGAYLSALETQRGFENVEAILLLADCDSDPKAAFQNVCDQMSAIGYVAPVSPLDVSRTAGKPALTIIMIPFDNAEGNLETFIGRAMQDVWNPEWTSAREHIGRTDAIGWSISKQGKALMQCMIAVLHEPDPNNSLAHIWTNSAAFRGILKHQAFNEFADFLKGFAALLRRKGPRTSV